MVKTKPIDIHTLEQDLFGKEDPVKKLLKLTLEIFEARQVGILYGTKHQSKISAPSLMGQGDHGQVPCSRRPGSFSETFWQTHCYY